MHKSDLLKRGLLLEYITLFWNLVGCFVVLVAAYFASSVALVGFGLDSVIEIFASVVVVWQLKSIKERGSAANKNKEAFAEKLIGVAFLILAAYILIQSTYTLLLANHPGKSVIGIVWLFITALAMFLLAYGKGDIGKKLGNPVLQKESKITVIDGLLAVAVLIGICLNAAFGLWWADPLAGMLIVYYGFKEGIQAIKS